MSGLELTPVEYAVGLNPIQNLPLAGRAHDAGIIPHQFPFEDGRSEIWYSIINCAPFSNQPSKYYNLTGNNSLYDYAKASLFLDYHHYFDFNSTEAKRDAMKAEWT